MKKRAYRLRWSFCMNGVDVSLTDYELEYFLNENVLDDKNPLTVSKLNVKNVSEKLEGGWGRGGYLEGVEDEC